MSNNNYTQAEWLARIFRRTAYITHQKIDEKIIERVRVPDHRGEPGWEKGEKPIRTVSPDDFYKNR